MEKYINIIISIIYKLISKNDKSFTNLKHSINGGKHLKGIKRANKSLSIKEKTTKKSNASDTSPNTGLSSSKWKNSNRYKRNSLDLHRTKRSGKDDKTRLRNIRVILLKDAKKTYLTLKKIATKQELIGKTNSDEIQLLKSIHQKIKLIEKDPFYENNIKKMLIPKEYDVSNLWRVELSNYWRMLYTIKGDQIEIICFILDIISHENYNKKFKYKKR